MNCCFPRCRCEWSNRAEDCPRYGGTRFGVPDEEHKQAVLKLREQARERENREGASEGWGEVEREPAPIRHRRERPMTDAISREQARADDPFAFDIGEEVRTFDHNGNWTGQGVIVGCRMEDGTPYYDIEDPLEGRTLRYCETEVDR
jgi:hypothetical protein